MSDTHVADPPFPDTVVVDGVVCYKGGDAAADEWFYVPADPDAERAGGKPTVQLLASPQSGILQLGAEWGLRSAAIEHVEAEVRRLLGGRAIQLAPAPAVVRRVLLETLDERGTATALAESTSSGFPPYRAIFRVELDAAAMNLVVAALNGRRGCLAVRYRVSVPVRVSVEVRVEGDVAGAQADLPADASDAASRVWLDAAIEARRVIVTIEGEDQAGDHLIERARSMALDSFVRLLASSLAGASAAPAGAGVRLRATATASEIIPRELERVADISRWFGPGEGAGHIVVVPGPGGTGPVAPGTATPVALASVLPDLPVAFVEIRCGDRKVLLKPPRFEPATLDATSCDGGLTITAHFTTGAEPFRSVLPIAQTGRIPPAALGLTEIVVDGRERQAAGARDIRARVQLRASRPQVSEDRTFYFRDDTWQGAFVVVTRGAPIDGACELEWKETTRDGKIRRHRSTGEPNQSVFVLREAEPDPGVRS